MNQSHIILLASVALTFIIVFGTLGWLWRSIFGGTKPAKKSNGSSSLPKEIAAEGLQMMTQCLLFLFSMVQFVIVGVFRLLGMIFIAGSGRKKKKDDPYSGRFLGWWERLRLYNTWNKGIRLTGTADRLTRKQSFRHALVIGNSGSGKSTVISFNNVIREKAASMIVFDPSGEIYHKTAGWKQRQGYRVQVFAPTSEKTHTFNPLAYAKDKGGISRVAKTLIAQTLGSGASEQAYWQSGATMIIQLMATFLRTTGPATYTLASLKHLLESLAADPVSTSRWVSLTVPNNKDWTAFTSFITQPENVWRGMVSTAVQSLEPLDHEVIAAVTSTNTLDLGSLRREKSILYICVPEERIAELRCLNALIFDQLFQGLMQMRIPGKPYNDVFILADEAANMGKINALDVYLTCLRKRNVNICLMIQSRRQLHAVYGADLAEVIYENTASKVFFAGLSNGTTQDVSQSLGRRGIENDRGAITTSTELLSPDSLRCLGENEGLLLVGNKRPWISRMHRYYQSYWLRRRTRYVLDLQFPPVLMDPPVVEIPIAVDNVNIDLPQSA